MRRAFLIIPTLLLLTAPAIAVEQAPVPAKVRAACNTEIQRLCGDARGSNQVLDCLRGNDRVSDHNCKDALRSIGQEKMTMPAGGHYDASRGHDKTVPPR